MKPEHILIANKTARTKGMIGKNAIVPKYVKQIARKSDTILDFGSGPQAIHTQMLRENGFHATAYDFGNNVAEGIHDVYALKRKYDIVFASNVLNTLSDVEDIKATIVQLEQVVGDRGKLIVNVPASPRKLMNNAKDTHKIVYDMLKQWFVVVNRVGGTASAPIYEATNTMGE